MKLTIVRPDNSVIIDGEHQKIDCSDLPEYVFAIQWNGEKGHIEYTADSKGRHQPNVAITDIAPYNYLVEKWQAAKSEQVKD